MHERLILWWDRCMDSVSRLVRLARLDGAVDVRGLMAGDYVGAHPAAPPGEVQFHLVLEGRCTVTAGGTGVELTPGDLLLLPQGDAHRVTSAGEERFEFTERPGPAFAPRQTVDADPELDLFCGH